MSDANRRLRRITHRQRAQQPWWCDARMVIDQIPDVLGLNTHECQLVNDHYGPHQCWCEVLFTDARETLEHTPLPGFEGGWQPGEIVHWGKVQKRW